MKFKTGDVIRIRDLGGIHERYRGQVGVVIGPSPREGRVSIVLFNDPDGTTTPWDPPEEDLELLDE